MFETAVLGPMATRGLGVVRQCIACRAAAGPQAPSCPGFGAGCLVQSAATAASSTCEANRDAKRSTACQSVYS
jgi:hypothetical protein